MPRHEGIKPSLGFRLWMTCLPPDLRQAVMVLVSYGISPDLIRPLLFHFPPGRRIKRLKTKQGRRGRPVEWTDESRRGLLEIVNELQEQALKSRGHLTDKAALKQFLSEYASMKGLSPSFVREKLKSYQNQLSFAKKNYPKKSEI